MKTSPPDQPRRRKIHRLHLKRPLLHPKIEQSMVRMREQFEEAVAPTIAPLSTVERRVDKSNLGQRVGTGLSLAAVSAVLVYLGVSWFAVEAMALITIGVIEFCALCQRKGLSPSRGLAITGGLVIISSYAWAPQQYLGNIVAVTCIATMICFLFRRAPDGGLIEPRFLDGVSTVFAYLYVAWLFGFALLLRRLPGDLPLEGVKFDAGAVYLYMVIITTAFSDIGCFAFGKAFGKHPLAPRISPGKTLEGSLGGLLVATLTGLAFGYWIRMEPQWALFYGFGVGLASQLGDLWESAMKRDAGVKDSGRVLAGHGGILDRFDSYFFAAPVAYFLIVWIMYSY